MRHTGINKDGVEVFTERRGAVAVLNVDPRHRREIARGAGGEVAIDFHTEQSAGWSNALRHDCGVIPESGADVQHAVARFQRERVDRDR